eukprot:913221-Amphidinium_carterae.1
MMRMMMMMMCVCLWSVAACGLSLLLSHELFGKEALPSSKRHKPAFQSPSSPGQMAEERGAPWPPAHGPRKRGRLDEQWIRLVQCRLQQERNLPEGLCVCGKRPTWWSPNVTQADLAESDIEQTLGETQPNLLRRMPKKHCGKKQHTLPSGPKTHQSRVAGVVLGVPRRQLKTSKVDIEALAV